MKTGAGASGGLRLSGRRMRQMMFAASKAAAGVTLDYWDTPHVRKITVQQYKQMKRHHTADGSPVLVSQPRVKQDQQKKLQNKTMAPSAGETESLHQVCGCPQRWLVLIRNMDGRNRTGWEVNIHQ